MPETFIAEYGRDQFEITLAPCSAVEAADRAVILREITRETARLMGWSASFAPKTSVDSVGNGVHIHYSLADDRGNPVSYDPAMPGGASRLMASFYRRDPAPYASVGCDHRAKPNFGLAIAAA